MGQAKSRPASGCRPFSRSEAQVGISTEANEDNEERQVTSKRGSYGAEIDDKKQEEIGETGETPGNAADASLAPPQIDPNAEYANTIPILLKNPPATF